MRVVDEAHGGIDDFLQVVRRHVGGHADGDAGGTVDEQVGNRRGKDLGFLAGRVVVVDERDGLFLEIRKQAHAGPRQASLGVTHGCGTVAVHGTEVALSIDEHVSQRPFLRHADHGFVHSGVAVRVVLSEHVTDDERRLAVGAVRRERQLAHGVEDAAMDGLESVARIRKRAADDDGHGVVEERLAHLLLERAGGDAAGHGCRVTVGAGWRRGSGAACGRRRGALRGRDGRRRGDRLDRLFRRSLRADDDGLGSGDGGRRRFGGNGLVAVLPQATGLHFVGHLSDLRGTARNAKRVAERSEVRLGGRRPPVVGDPPRRNRGAKRSDFVVVRHR